MTYMTAVIVVLALAIAVVNALLFLVLGFIFYGLMQID
jgi:hypothetical protein